MRQEENSWILDPKKRWKAWGLQQLSWVLGLRPSLTTLGVELSRAAAVPQDGISHTSQLLPGAWELRSTQPRPGEEQLVNEDQNSEAKGEFLTAGDTTTTGLFIHKIVLENLCSAPRHSTGCQR